MEGECKFRWICRVVEDSNEVSGVRNKANVAKTG